MAFLFCSEAAWNELEVFWALQSGTYEEETPAFSMKNLVLKGLVSREDQEGEGVE